MRRTCPWARITRPTRSTPTVGASAGDAQRPGRTAAARGRRRPGSSIRSAPDCRRRRPSARSPRDWPSRGPTRSTCPSASLDTRRDFVDVRDVARALIALAMQRPAGTGLPCRDGSLSLGRRGLDVPHRSRAVGRSSARGSRPAPSPRPGRLPRRDRPDRRRDRLGAADLVRARASRISGARSAGSSARSTPGAEPCHR